MTMLYGINFHHRPSAEVVSDKGLDEEIRNVEMNLFITKILFNDQGMEILMIFFGMLTFFSSSSNTSD